MLSCLPGPRLSGRDFRVPFPLRNDASSMPDGGGQGRQLARMCPREQAGAAGCRRRKDRAGRAGRTMAVTVKDIADLVARAAGPNTALMRGDIDGYLALISHAEDFTLMTPFGGPPTAASIRRAAGWRRWGASSGAAGRRWSLVQAYASGDLAVLVVIERRTVEVGGLPDRDWSLRVALVFRRDGPEWRLVHRRADPLVKGVSLEQAAAIARGTPDRRPQPDLAASFPAILGNRQAADASVLQRHLPSRSPRR